MQRLTDSAWQKVCDMAQRYGISTDAVLTMLQAVVNGNGTMAQFYCPELGGGGQWMLGGMTMVGDMFNYGLKSRVDGLCTELSQLLMQQPFIPLAPASQSTGGYASGAMGGGSWWPHDLGSPNSSGGQNNVRYAYFANARRLAVELNGAVTVFDTLDHQIGGVSQQQGASGSLTFSSQYGTVDIASLPIISLNGAAAPSAAAQPFAPQNTLPMYSAPAEPNNSRGAGSGHETDIFATIERLANLQRKGILSQEEFAAKKAELLGRL